MTSQPAFARFAGDFEMLAAALAALSMHCPARTTLRQAVLLSMIAYCHAMGRSVTLADLVEAAGPGPDVDAVTGEREPLIGRAVERSVFVFHEPNRHYHDALGWVTKVNDPDDMRKKYLHLTPKGEAALADVIKSLTPH